jgi:hypothetical protein
MKKQGKKLMLARDTLRGLEVHSLAYAVGAQSGPIHCFTTTNSANTNCDVCVTIRTRLC